MTVRGRTTRLRLALVALVAVDELRPVWKAFNVAVSFDTGEDDLRSAPVRIFDRRGVWVSTPARGR